MAKMKSQIDSKKALTFYTSIATVNLITLFGGSVDSIISFPDNKRGNKEVEKLFTTKLEEHGITDEEEISDAIDNGHYEVSMGKEEYFIVHSV